MALSRGPAGAASREGLVLADRVRQALQVPTLGDPPRTSWPVTRGQFDEALQVAFEPSERRVSVGTESLTLRLLRPEDAGEGFMDLVRELSGGEALGEQEFAALAQRRLSGGHLTMVVVQDARPGSRVIGTFSMLLEHKFSHDGGLAAHLEDVVVERDLRGCGVGRAMVDAARVIGETLGAYKVILDCSDENVGFYQSTGFEPSETMMKLKLS